MLRKIRMGAIRKVLAIIAALRTHYKQQQQEMVIGSIEWKYYQSKLNALTDLEYAMEEEFNIKIL